MAEVSLIGDEMRYIDCPVFCGGEFYMIRIGSSFSLNPMDAFEGLRSYFPMLKYNRNPRGLPWNAASLISRYRPYIYWALDVEEIQLTYLDLIERSKNKTFDCSGAIELFCKDMSALLDITPDQYKAGKYDITKQMIKRLENGTSKQ